MRFRHYILGSLLIGELLVLFFSIWPPVHPIIEWNINSSKALFFGGDEKCWEAIITGINRNYEKIVVKIKSGKDSLGKPTYKYYDLYYFDAAVYDKDGQKKDIYYLQINDTISFCDGTFYTDSSIRGVTKITDLSR